MCIGIYVANLPTSSDLVITWLVGDKLDSMIILLECLINATYYDTGSVMWHVGPGADGHSAYRCRSVMPQ